MSNYYARKNNGDWVIRSSRNEYPCEFSASMEIAYQMGRMDYAKELPEKIKRSVDICEDALDRCNEVLIQLESDLAKRGKPSDEMVL
jgi:hypothetical protein